MNRRGFSRKLSRGMWKLITIGGALWILILSLNHVPELGKNPIDDSGLFGNRTLAGRTGSSIEKGTDAPPPIPGSDSKGDEGSKGDGGGDSSDGAVSSLKIPQNHKNENAPDFQWRYDTARAFVAREALAMNALENDPQKAARHQVEVQDKVTKEAFPWLESIAMDNSLNPGERFMATYLMAGSKDRLGEEVALSMSRILSIPSSGSSSQKGVDAERVPFQDTLKAFAIETLSELVDSKSAENALSRFATSQEKAPLWLRNRAAQGLKILENKNDPRMDPAGHRSRQMSLKEKDHEKLAQLLGDDPVQKGD